MRKPLSDQGRFDKLPISNVTLNLNCRDEIVPILAGLQHIYSQPALRDKILDLVEQDVNEDSRNDCGREGLGYWEITVLAAVRLGCNLDYDKLQDLAEQHRALRQIMGIGDWQGDADDFRARRIRDNVCTLKPETIQAISHCIVEEAYRLEPEAVEKQRADSFVVETNIHYPTESSLIVDGTRKVIELSVKLYEAYDITGWRQHEHLLKKIKQTARQISRISSRKGGNFKERLKKQYRKLLVRARRIITRAFEMCDTLLNEYEYMNDPLDRLLDLKRNLWRSARCQIDAGLTTGRLAQTDAMKLLKTCRFLKPFNRHFHPSIMSSVPLLAWASSARPFQRRHF